MVFDLGIARLAFAQSSTPADALLNAARLRLEVATAQGEAQLPAPVSPQVAPVEALSNRIAAGLHQVDRRA